jgi:hypothetical protein
MPDNYLPLLQYVEHDLEEVQWHDGAGDSTTNYQFPMMPSREPRFVQKLDELHQQSPGKYLRHERKLACKKHSKRYKGVSGNLTSQHLTNGLNDTNKKGVAFLKMYDSGHQT